MSTHSIAIAFALSGFLLGAQHVSAQSTSNRAMSDAAVPTDNTGSNKGDQTQANADAQKNDKADLQMTRAIRKQVISDKSLSMYAHNVKIITVDGTVTLNGVVRSDEERAAIETKAASVAGQDHVINDLKVAPAQ